MSKQQGYLLFSVLIFLHLYTLLGLNTLALVASNEHENSLLQAQDRLKQQARTLLTRLERQLARKIPSCQLSFPATKELKNKNVAWWQAQACRVQESTYKAYYIVEPLDVDPCALIANYEFYQAAYYRLHLLLVSTSLSPQKLSLKATFARPIMTANHCATRRHTVPFGQQSWQEI